MRSNKLPLSLMFATAAGRWSARRDDAIRQARTCQYADLKAELVTNARACHHRYLITMRWAREAQHTEHNTIRNMETSDAI